MFFIHSSVLICIAIREKSHSNAARYSAPACCYDIMLRKIQTPKHHMQRADSNDITGQKCATDGQAGQASSASFQQLVKVHCALPS
jgi:hypothetical protein